MQLIYLRIIICIKNKTKRVFFFTKNKRKRVALKIQKNESTTHEQVVIIYILYQQITKQRVWFFTSRPTKKAIVIRLRLTTVFLLLLRSLTLTLISLIFPFQAYRYAFLYVICVLTFTLP